MNENQHFFSVYPSVVFNNQLYRQHSKCHRNETVDAVFFLCFGSFVSHPIENISLFARYFFRVNWRTVSFFCLTTFTFQFVGGFTKKKNIFGHVNCLYFFWFTLSLKMRVYFCLLLNTLRFSCHNMSTCEIIFLIFLYFQWFIQNLLNERKKKLQKM